ncbi:Acyl-CoA synthetase (AMP-forming)/AMP-acid ligase II [Streptoalloteichus tenebrarius]|uniref:Acyl-CoA synthetase (AMP-forming)/AMP-acid ligase II n=1 Tax=Streptoalloteichus tenebrarius (strain ATCC 17920 / DSM 40477 / JCM 4838 / CBS 697.72 / NBRC 16177 / NCIMB 11028 / NRRL B-12390 / A12253. 1 / ISP 5477) TaxID=1933 RepID=A0ABT1HRJ7_STRSD|nr:AMP-binding protein [Streptoalloteichus tenebrarius]MCP2258145.1 Acyl-CoA synthetase (AMP-forming)/AMP-acid ligase II [Streptoalloteichus tenebrarius]BFF04628.1 class I adenylate-forming enzyme family protein [Streptoalloteichus tenebrarius]
MTDPDMTHTAPRTVDTSGWAGADTLGVVHPEPMHAVLLAAADRTPHAPAVSDRMSTVDYQGLCDAALRAATVLRSRGVRRGDRVLVEADPRWEFVALLYAASMVGAVTVPLGTGTKAFHARHIRADVDPALVVGSGGLTWDELVAATETSAPATADTPGPGDPALIFYTSGSSGMPKGVVCPHGQVGFTARAIADRVPYHADDVVLLRLPLSFDYGCYQIPLCALAGAHLVLADPRDNAGFLRALRAAGTTVLPVVPSLARLLLTLAGRDSAPTRLRLLTNTGERLDETTQRALRDRFPGLTMALMYGLTECKRVSVGLVGPDAAPTDSVGRPLPGTSVAVLGPDGTPLPPGEVGEIAVTGPNLTDGYWRAPELTARRFGQCRTTGRRVLFTGDLGSLDADGELRVHGREDDIFKNAGVRVSATEIEAAALDVPGVTAAGVALPVGPEGAVLWAVGSATPAEILAGLRERLEPARVPAACRVVAALPQTANGKIDRRALARWRTGSS